MAESPQNIRNFPIAEVFGFPPFGTTPQGSHVQAHKLCPFAGNRCEKYRQYGLGYCSVTYAAEADAGARQIYAVCDHRLDGPPVRSVVIDYFGSIEGIRTASEVVLTEPRISFDYVAFKETNGVVTDAVAIETQAVDLRGGGVGPAFRAWEDGKAGEWREYFSEEAKTKGRRDTVAYGVNMGNIYKRLGLQVAEKGTFLKSIGVRLYVLMQDLPYAYLRNRIRFQENEAADAPWDVTFLTFEYEPPDGPDGQLGFHHRRTVRTTLESYVSAMAANNRGNDLREQFLRQVQIKAGRAKDRT